METESTGKRPRLTLHSLLSLACSSCLFLQSPWETGQNIRVVCSYYGPNFKHSSPALLFLVITHCVFFCSLLESKDKTAVYMLLPLCSFDLISGHISTFSTIRQRAPFLPCLVLKSISFKYSNFIF